MSKDRRWEIDSVSIQIIEHFAQSGTQKRSQQRQGLKNSWVLEEKHREKCLNKEHKQNGSLQRQHGTVTAKTR